MIINSAGIKHPCWYAYHGGTLGNIFNDYRVGSDLGSITDMNSTQDAGTGANENVIPNNGKSPFVAHANRYIGNDAASARCRCFS